MAGVFWVIVFFAVPILATLFYGVTDFSIGLSALSGGFEFLYSQPLYGLSVLAGNISFVWLINQLFIAGRVKIIERSFGLDREYRFHALMGFVIIHAGVIHKILKELSGYSKTSQTLFGVLAVILMGLISVYSMFFLGQSFLTGFKPIKLFRDFMVKNLKIGYRFSKIVHSLLILAVLLIALHIYFSSAFYLPVKWFYISYTILGLMVYIYFKKKSLSYGYIITEVIKHANNVTSIRFFRKNGSKPPFVSGQFGFFRYKGESHPFTISTDPSDNKLMITVKSLGDYTTSIIPNAIAGEEVGFDGPYGIFGKSVFRKDRPVVMIAGGIGITPFFSIIKGLTAINSDKKLYLLWGAATQSDLVRKDELDDAKNRLKSFDYCFVLSNQSDFAGESGYINKELISKKIGSTLIDDPLFLLCGPPVMMNKLVKDLVSLGVKKSDIIFEKFSL